jgi:hypothetical protein
MSSQNIALTVIGSSVSQPVQLSKTQPFKSQGFSYILLSMQSPTHIKNLIIKNAGTPFLTILAGDSTQAKRLRRSVTRQQHCQIFDEMQTLVCETQLCTPEQLATKHKQIDKVKSIRQFSRCVNHSKAVFSCLAVLLRPFSDQRDVSVGLGWLECYGEVKTDADEQQMKQYEHQLRQKQAAILDHAFTHQNKSKSAQPHKGVKRSLSPVKHEIKSSPSKRAKLAS